MLSQSNNRIRPAEAYGQYLGNTKNLKDYLLRWLAEHSAKGTPSGKVLELEQNLRARRDTLRKMVAMPGMARWARLELDDEGFDIAADLAAADPLFDAILSACEAAIPVNEDGVLLARKRIDGEIKELSLAANAKAVTDLRSLLQELCDLIED